MDKSSTKTRAEREDQESERLVRKAPKYKPSRHDKKRERVDSESDPDLSKSDKDLSMNYKNVGGSVVARCIISSYLKGKAMVSNSKTSLYHGVDPQDHYPEGLYTGWGQAHQRDLGESDYKILVESARQWLSKPLLSEEVALTPEQRFQHALDLAIQTSPYASQITPSTYDLLLGRLFGSTRLASSRDKVERAVYRAFPPDSKSKRGGRLEVMLTGNTAKILREPEYTTVVLGELSEEDLRKLATLLRVKTASVPETSTFIFDGFSQDVADDLESYTYSYSDGSGEVREDGYLRVIQTKIWSGKAAVRIEHPPGAQGEALKAAQFVAQRHELTAKVASSSIETVVQGSNPTQPSEDRQERAMFKLSSVQKSQANQLLGRLDKLASTIQANAEKWGMPFEAARQIVNELDKTADAAESFIFGQDSLQVRQAEMAFHDQNLAKAAKELVGEEVYNKAARVLQRDSDESYMDTFNSPMQPHETDGDEPYMSAYSDDESEAVATGEDEDGDDLAPEYDGYL